MLQNIQYDDVTNRERMRRYLRQQSAKNTHRYGVGLLGNVKVSSSFFSDRAHGTSISSSTCSIETRKVRSEL